jgi:hypothetical protein
VTKRVTSIPVPPQTPAGQATGPPTSSAAPRPLPSAPPAANNGIPQGNGGDHDADDNGIPNDGDGNL